METESKTRSNVISLDEFVQREFPKADSSEMPQWVQALSPTSAVEYDEGTGPHNVLYGKGGSGKSNVNGMVWNVILTSAVANLPVEFAVIRMGESRHDYAALDMLPQVVGVYESPEPEELDTIIAAIIDSREEFPEPKHLYLMVDTPPLLPVEIAEHLHTALQRIETRGEEVGVTAVVYAGHGFRDRAA